MAEGFTNSLNNYGKLSLTNLVVRQGEFINTSKSFHQNIKDFFKKMKNFLKKFCQVFEELFLQNKDIKPIITHQYCLSQFKCLILATN